MPELRSSADALRWALLVALGLSPLTACGRTATDAGDDGGEGPSGATGSGGTGGAAPGERACTNPQDRVPGKDTGFVTCEEGFTHRPRVTLCPSSWPRPGVLEPGSPPQGGAGGTFECVSDADCGPDSLCECGTNAGRCVPAACKSDDDCEGAARCVGNTWETGCGLTTVYSCETTRDECVADGDCDAGRTCQVQGDGARVCGFSSCAIGRPFLVDFLERRARLEERSDWLVDIGQVALEGLDWTERRALAAHWAEIGLMEHASIAAFARFTLQLVSVGAPDELLNLVERAQADETRHARLCFSLASQYGGRDVGPGAISMAGALDDLSLESILSTTILEGCIGETRAALEAARARDNCSDPVVREVLAQIARDEGNHAALAWRFVRWMLDEYPELEALFRQTLARARPIGSPEPVVPNCTRLRRGVLGANDKARVEAQAWLEVIDPSARALLNSRRGLPSAADSSAAE